MGVREVCVGNIEIKIENTHIYNMYKYKDLPKTTPNTTSRQRQRLQPWSDSSKRPIPCGFKTTP